jgi:hypothetical protein
MALPFSEGSVFLVPLRDGGYARGVVARSRKRGIILLGYFFGPALKPTDQIAMDDLDPTRAVLRIRFGDCGLLNGTWPVQGLIPGWNRSEWPMPDFVRRDPLSHRAWLVRYSDSDPRRIEAEYPTEYDSALASDSMYGDGAVEITLTMLLAKISP